MPTFGKTFTTSFCSAQLGQAGMPSSEKGRVISKR
jgi:hypothetical protein